VLEDAQVEHAPFQVCPLAVDILGPVDATEREFQRFLDVLKLGGRSCAQPLGD
jgi:hypothetical protein